jgi:hypothetical protein
MSNFETDTIKADSFSLAKAAEGYIPTSNDHSTWWRHEDVWGYHLLCIEERKGVQGSEAATAGHDARAMREIELGLASFHLHESETSIAEAVESDAEPRTSKLRPLDVWSDYDDGEDEMSTGDLDEGDFTSDGEPINSALVIKSSAGRASRRQRRNCRPGKRSSESVRGKKKPRGKKSECSDKKKKKRKRIRNKIKTDVIRHGSFSMASSTQPISTGWHGTIAHGSPELGHAAERLGETMRLVPYIYDHQYVSPSGFSP